jgi:diguanylate cyclase (GGDEF)-like protein/PAS domain S-box-containing protein
MTRQANTARLADGAGMPGATTLGLAIAGPDQVIRYANEAFLAIVGNGAMAGQPLSMLYEHGDATCAAGIREAFATGSEHATELACTRGTGEHFVAELALVPVVDTQGALMHFVLVLRDASNIGRVELALETSNRQLQALLDHLPAGVVVHAADSRVLSANAMAARLLGRSADQLAGRAAEDRAWHFLRADGSVLPLEEYPICQTLQRKASLSNLVVGIDRGPELGLVWTICNTYLLCDHLGGLAEAVVCFTDCTDLKHAEQSRHKSEERLRLMLQGANDAAWDLNLATEEFYYSPRWWEMLGRRPGELPSDAELWLRLAHPDDQLTAGGAFASALRGTSHTYELELRLRHRDGHYVPVLARGFILRDEQGRAVRVSGTNTDLTERKEAERNIHQLAYFDYLTGLPNRRFLMEQLPKLLSRCARTRAFGALLFIDLDNFKLLNDTLGHDVGDLLLRQVADRLRHAVRESDYVSRLGGDEFVIVLEDLGTDAALAAAEADAVGSKVLAVCGDTYALPARRSRSTPSIGIAMFSERTESVDVLLRQADLAMYQAKAAGRNTLRFFDPLMQAAIDRRYALEHDLREGLLRRQFMLYCQPQFDGAGQLLGAEVLLRWNHPERGVVGPGEFIALAEATGLVLPLGRWVLRET